MNSRGGGDPSDPALLAALALSQQLGMLGSRPVGEVVDHAHAFVEALAATPAGGTVVDLGSGGGVPGLVVAWVRDDLFTVLVERRSTRADHLRRLVGRLGLGDRVQVAAVDAHRLRGVSSAAAVTARGFGTPRAVLTTARPLLSPGGIAVVSEPPAFDKVRWPAELLDELSLVRVAHPDRRVAVFRRHEPDVPRESSGSATKGARVSTLLIRGRPADRAVAVTDLQDVPLSPPADTVPAEAVPAEAETVPLGAPNAAAPAVGGEAPESAEAAPARPSHRLPRVIAVANQKGGVGKTTTTVNLGACLAELGQRVLIVDLDPQGNASTGLGIENRGLAASMYHVLMHEVPLDDCIEPTDVRGLFVAPASLDLAGAEIELVPAFSRELRLARAIAAVLDEFDYVLIDCPPSLGLLTVNGLSAAREVLVPIQCEYYALEGLGQLLRNVDLVQRNLNAALHVSTIVCVMYDARTKLADQVVSEVREHFGNKVLNTVVPRSVRLAEAPSFGQPITTFDPRSRGAIAYRDVAKEVHDVATQRSG